MFEAHGEEKHSMSRVQQPGVTAWIRIIISMPDPWIGAGWTTPESSSACQNYALLASLTTLQTVEGCDAKPKTHLTESSIRHATKDRTREDRCQQNNFGDNAFNNIY